MNRLEARRYAHRIVAEAIQSVPRRNERQMHKDDAEKINQALVEITETHSRFGPRSDDAEPRAPIYKGEPLSFETPTEHAHDYRYDQGSSIGRCACGAVMIEGSISVSQVEIGNMDEARCPECNAPASEPLADCPTCGKPADEQPGVL